MDSKLQIISGKHRGRKLFLPSLSDARPTQTLARGALFNMLNEFVDMRQPVTVWDAFAGSGAFGLEFLSRYVNADVIFTDNSARSIDTIKKNLGIINEKATIIKTDAIAEISKYGAVSDLIFIDAPYSEFELGVLFVKKLTNVAKSGAILIWEFENIHDFPKISDSWAVLKDKVYGRARFLLLRKN